MTDGKGLNVILNSSSGEALHDSWDCIAPFGTFIELGKSDIYRRTHISMEPFDRNVSFASIDLVMVAENQPTVLYRVLTRVFSLFESGVLKAVEPITIMDLKDIEGAFRQIQARKHSGKLVLEARHDTFVKTLPASPTPLRLEGNVTYVIAGGLGDLGLSICRLMVLHGSKNIILLSRRKLDAERHRLLETEIGALGARVRPIMCDITDAKQVEDVAALCRDSMPPVKGIIQAAMVLKDGILDRMSASDFKVAVEPKAAGTIYLTKAFEGPSLEFFISLSSIACVLGSKSQANYAAGNAFMDALAQSRDHYGAHHLSINLGFVDGSDQIASRIERRQAILREGGIPIKLDQLLGLLKYLLSAQARKDRYRQIVVGFDRDSVAYQSAQKFESPMFYHLAYTLTEGGVEARTEPIKTVHEAVQAAADLEEVSEIFAAAIAK
ncbi:hypothetical protein ABVK25_012499 [Lepraria finkii]|uniref:Ketoreductase (KR) domain-containing protein n=1 Tax=Lepraria finkii TaxID=1340010 RepID=A0ABR4AE09_9LECA